ncbi:MAG: alpha-glucosidase [Candidatus Izemoplasmatales bacterium]
MKQVIKPWQKYSVYQIYPLSYQDANGDGIGDINGIISRLEYIQNLGIDVIWLSPIYESPMDDNGYDISNYYEINPMFGTKDDFQRLLSKVHELGMRLIMDLVVNHTSDMHPWFLESQKSIDNPYRDYYIWRKEATQIGSVFSGPAWQFQEETGEYFFHLFSKRQPDLNWQNEKLRQEIYKMINYWLDFGVDGFRLDVIDLIGKDVDTFRIGDGPYLNQYLKEMYDTCFKGRDTFTVGEMPSVSIERTREITDLEHGYLNMIFHFGHLGYDEIPGQGKWALKEVDYPSFFKHFQNLQKDLFESGWNSLFFENHDQPRSVSRYGSLAHRKKSAKALMTFLYMMQGTPYIYQGQEIGMTNTPMTDINDYRDIETLNMYRDKIEHHVDKEEIMRSILAKSRDNARTPMQWDASMNAGFSNTTPWLSVNPNFHEINVQADLKDPEGIYDYTKRLLTIRKTEDVLINGEFVWCSSAAGKVAVYLRQNDACSLLVISSFDDQPNVIDLSLYQDYELLLSNEETIVLSKKTELSPYHASVWIKKEKEND